MDRVRICPRVGHLVSYPAMAHSSPWGSARHSGTGLVVDVDGIRLHILSSEGDLIKGIRRDSVEVIG